MTSDTVITLLSLAVVAALCGGYWLGARMQREADAIREEHRDTDRRQVLALAITLSHATGCTVAEVIDTLHTALDTPAEPLHRTGP